MLYTIQNEQCSLCVETKGAQMMSIRSCDATEYLWQGDPQYWPDRAPVLFPFIGRLTQNSITCFGKRFPMTIHGFAAQEEFDVISLEKNRVILAAHSNENTMKSYPFDFLLQISYELQENTIIISYCVKNSGNTVMPFAIGGHPGFNVPLEKDERFEDYYLEFSQPALPERIGFSPQLFINGTDLPYPLENDRILPLSHNLFEEDAIILKNMAKSVCLRSKKSGKGVTVSYPEFAYLGIWHCPKSDAPYVCIEPWTSLPSRHGIVEELSCKSDMLQLLPGKSRRFSWSIRLHA